MSATTRPAHPSALAEITTTSTVGVPPDLRDEAALVDAAKAGDRLAFTALYDRHVARVYRHCYYRVANRADAEDLTQQTFLQAWQAIGRYRPGTTPFIAWLLTISQRLAINHHRQTPATTDLASTERLVEDDDPAVALTTSVTRDAVRRAILRLSPERRDVIILRFIEGFAVSEVAVALGKAPNTISVLQHRALADLRKSLGSPVPDTWPSGDSLLQTRFRDVVGATVRRIGGGSRPTYD
jgi:RNA polymerase sigma-70 factor (ECF subfamily)